MFRLTSGFFMCWIDNVCFANTQRNDSEGILLFADKQLKFMP